jgi:agmatinase
MPQNISKEEKTKKFDPTAMALSGRNIFGLPFTTEESELVILPVPWEATVSYKKGTAKAPARVLEASAQVDLYDPEVKDLWKMGISMEPISKVWANKNKELRVKAEKHLDTLYMGGKINVKDLVEINAECRKLHTWVKEEALRFIKKGKLVAMVGGEHSTALGMMEAMAETYKSFGVLQLDAHHDLREAYEGFTYSHASIMWNAMKLPAISKLTGVGIRDYGENEATMAKNSKGRISTFYDRDMANDMSAGATWKEICKKIVATLPKNVYVSFDIDGLDPKLCPNTGTPVAGGLEYEQALYLLEQVVTSGKKIIGFDINEIGDGEWDANVGARLLYRMSALFAKSAGKIK